MLGLRGATSTQACPGITSGLSIGVFVGLHRRVRLIKLEQMTCLRFIFVRPKFSQVQLAFRKRWGTPHLTLARLQETQ
jgi:hypothetical protein